jgi:hypothetical protein
MGRLAHLLVLVVLPAVTHVGVESATRLRHLSQQCGPA